MPLMTSRMQAAERELAAAINDSDLVDDLPADEANSYEGRRARYRAGVAIKAAEVHALLAIADALNSILLDLADDKAMAAAVEKEKEQLRERRVASLDQGFDVVDDKQPCRLARGLYCHRHGITHGARA